MSDFAEFDNETFVNESRANFTNSHLVFGHSTYNERADHTRESAHSIRNTHQYAGVPRSNVQVVDIKTFKRDRIREEIRNIGIHLF